MIPSMTSRNTSRLEPQHERLADEGAEHQRGAGDQAFQRDVARQRAKTFEGHRFAQIESERTRSFRGKERALGKAVKQEQRHG